MVATCADTLSKLLSRTASVVKREKSKRPPGHLLTVSVRAGTS